jgi:hypothetical protein
LTIAADFAARRTVDGWTYAYALPTDFLKVCASTPPALGAISTSIYEFDTETDATGQKILLTDVENPYLVYVRVIDDTSKFSPTFVTALSYLLASMLAGPVLKGEAGEAQANTGCRFGGRSSARRRCSTP